MMLQEALDSTPEPPEIELRDFYAGLAMVGILMGPPSTALSASIEVRAYEMADRMLAERQRMTDKHREALAGVMSDALSRLTR